MGNNNFEKYIRSDILKLRKYVAQASILDLAKRFKTRKENIIKLDTGENQYGYSKKVSLALRDKTYFRYYPDSTYKRLRKAISKYCRVNMNNIMVGSGSDELLDLILRLILEPDDEIINCPPTFGMYPILIEFNKGKLISVQRKRDFSLDVDVIKKKITKKTKAIFVCSPNNPTGTLASEEELISLLNEKILVIVDEAYFEFCDQTAIDLLAKHKNLVILRTFSKWAGIAGLRLGYLISHPFIVEQLLKIKLPYNVNLAAEVAGIAALKDLKTYRKITERIVKERERLKKILDKLSYLTVYPSSANFLFIRINENFDKLKKKLEKERIIVRYYNSKTTGKAIRITIGTPDQNNKVIKTLVSKSPLP